MVLENVTTEQRSLFFAGSPSVMAWAMLGAAAATLYGRAKASALEGRTQLVPATGDGALTDDRIALRLTVATKVSGIRIRGGSRTIDLEIPYRIIRQWRHESRGIHLDLVGRGELWLEPQDNGDFAQWLAHLSHIKTWQPPTPVELRVEVPVVSWCQQDPRFTFGLPAPWHPPQPNLFADFAREFYPDILRVGVGLAAGIWEAQVFVIEAGPVQGIGRPADVDSLAAMMLEATNISPKGPVHVSTVGGEHTVLLETTSWPATGPEERCYACLTHRGILFGLWYGIVGGSVGDGSYERWLPDFHTMLATWHWYQ